MVFFMTCPRCGQQSYERIKTYLVCHQCNFNSVEGFGWDQDKTRPSGIFRASSVHKDSKAFVVVDDDDSEIPDEPA
jgi:ribosomal protein L37E